MQTGDERKLKFIIIGDADVGKTTLFWRYTEGEYLDRKDSTVAAVDFKMKMLKYRDQSIKLYIWDTAGQERYRSIVATFFKGCHGMVLVYDLTRPQSFDNLVNQWYPLCQAKAEGTSMVVVGSKADLHQNVDQKTVTDWCDKHHIRYLKCSSKTGLNIEQPFMELVKLNFQQAAEPQFEKAQSFDISKMQVKKEKKKCC